MGVNVRKQDERNKKNGEEGSEWPQILAVLAAALTGLNSSILFNWTSPSIPILISSDDYEGIDIEMASYLTVIPPVVSILAAPVYGFCLDRVGRKVCLLAAGVFQVFSWLCIIFTKSLYIFYLSRVLFGLSHAAMFSVLPVYISEVTTPEVRGKWGNLMAFSFYLGQFITNAVAYFFDLKTTACIFISLPILFLIMFWICPETPYYYLIKNKTEEARNSLKKLRHLNNVDKEFTQLTTDVTRQLSERGSFKDCIMIKSNRKAIFIVAIGRALQQFSGISAFAAYNQYIFQEAGGDLDKGLSSIIYAFSLAGTSFIALMFLHKMGRRKPMIVSTICCSLVLTAEAIYFSLKDYSSVDVSAASWFPVTGMVLYVATFSSGLSLIPMLLLGEVFSTSIRSNAATIMTILSSSYQASVNKIFAALMTSYGLAAPFFLFGACTFVGIFFSYFCIPETKGKTLEEIQQMLKGNEKKDPKDKC